MLDSSLNQYMLSNRTLVAFWISNSRCFNVKEFWISNPFCFNVRYYCNGSGFQCNWMLDLLCLEFLINSSASCDMPSLLIFFFRRLFLVYFTLASYLYAHGTNYSSVDEELWLNYEGIKHRGTRPITTSDSCLAWLEFDLTIISDCLLDCAVQCFSTRSEFKEKGNTVLCHLTGNFGCSCWNWILCCMLCQNRGMEHCKALVGKPHWSCKVQPMERNLFHLCYFSHTTSGCVSCWCCDTGQWKKPFTTSRIFLEKYNFINFMFWKCFSTPEYFLLLAFPSVVGGCQSPILGLFTVVYV